MSSPGYFYTPEDQEAESALRRRQAFAQALMQQGGEDPGRAAYGGLRNAGNAILGAFLSKRADASERDLAKSAQAKYTADMASFLKGGAPAPALPQQGSMGPPNPSPQLTNNGGGQPPQFDPEGNPLSSMRAAPQVPSPLAMSPVQPPQQMTQGQPTSDPMSRLLATGNPALIQQFAPGLLQHQQEINDQRIIPLSDQEALRMGLRPGGVYGKNAATGNIAVIQQSDMKSQGAVGQEQDQARFTNQLPPTPYQKSELGLGYAQLNKPVSVGYGDTLVNPGSGKVVYGGQTAQNPLGPDGKPLTGAAYLATLPPGLASTAKAIAEYRQAPLSSMALRSPQGAVLMQAVNQINPGYDATQYGSKNKARLDFATGKNGNTVRSLNVAVQHLDQLGQLSDALANGNVQLVNKIGNFFASQTGGQAPTNFNAAKQIVGDEIVKAIVGTGGGSGDREKAQESINAASSPQQLAGVIRTYQGLMSGQLSGLKQQYEKSTGLHDFEDYLAPETKAKLQTHSAAPAKSRFTIEQVH